MLVDIELAALRAGLSRGLRLVDRRGDAMDMEDACEGEAAEARTDNGAVPTNSTNRATSIRCGRLSSNSGRAPSATAASVTEQSQSIGCPRRPVKGLNEFLIENRLWIASSEEQLARD